MQWTNLHYIKNPALRIAEQKNILMAQIENARQAQRERHHSELLSFENAKLMLEERLGLRRLEDEKQRHQDNMQMQRQQMSNQLQIANIQANNQIELQRMQSHSQMQLAMFTHFATISQQTNQAILTAMQTMINDIVNENQHQREMEKQIFLSRIELIKIKLNNKHEQEMKILNHNLLLVEKRLDSQLRKEEIDFEKYCTVFYKLLEKILELSERKQILDESTFNRWNDDVLYQMFACVQPNK